MKTRIVFVALYDNTHGRYMLQALINAGMAPCAVFIGSRLTMMQYRYRSILRYLRRRGIGETVERMLYRTFKRRDILPAQGEILPPDLCTQAQQYDIPIVRFDAINQARSIQRLRHYEPDFLVLGGAPLLRRSILDVPRYGVINTHPAKLPEIRGMDVVAWSILEGIPTGLSVFFVDEGIDTGPLLYFHEVPCVPHLSLEQIEQQLQKQAGIVTVKAIQDFLAGVSHPRAQQKQAGKLYKAMPGTTRKAVRRLLASHQQPSRVQIAPTCEQIHRWEW